MFKGTVLSIHITPAAAGNMISVKEVRAVPGKGLDGDRYFRQTGTYSKTPGSGREITLIASEAIEALGRDYGITIEAGESRRNIVTRGVPLDHLVGREFTVGAVRVRGVRLCEPCGHLEKLTREGVRAGLVHRGGLRAQILTEGTIRPGDPVEA
ncbi:MAG TPA: MOSC domain-containing protein [bacterium]|nr:MOSC domain-containing protein [bacterium]